MVRRVGVEPVTMWEVQPRFEADVHPDDVQRLSAVLSATAEVETATVMLQSGAAASVTPSLVLHAASPAAAVDRAITLVRSTAAACGIRLGDLHEVLARPALVDPRDT